MYVLGIDAGGTKTVCYLADSNGRIVGEGRGGGANLQAHGELEVEKVLHAVVEQAIGDRAILPVSVCLGVAGVDRKEDDQIVRAIMRRLGFRAHALVVNDALVALVAGAGDDPGVVLIAGTGSIAYGVNADGFAARSGGWGYVLGDEGSGYWIGRRALTAVVRAADARGPQTRLTSLVLEHFQLTRVDGLVREVYDKGLRRQSIAALGGVVEQARVEGDVVASEILRSAGEELARAGASVIGRLQMRGHSFRTVLAGGMFKVIPWLADDVVRRLAEVAPRTVVTRLDVEPAIGAVHLALREIRSGVRVPPYIDAERQATA
ncbi:MAG TPA: BadF/BadG/BcrA/BcrD ATPase family protein [Vicinamibacterales bacterium]|nr:BadF/BadG/BcrA/BcrD ATPase family protein [Vicinamibacterales bacterium]